MATQQHCTGACPSGANVAQIAIFKIAYHAYFKRASGLFVTKNFGNNRPLASFQIALPTCHHRVLARVFGAGFRQLELLPVKGSEKGDIFGFGAILGSIP
jgi:hypothetical protein